MTKKMRIKANEMAVEVIRMYGFENRNTIYFFEVMERTTKRSFWILEGLYNCMMDGVQY